MLDANPRNADACSSDIISLVMCSVKIKKVLIHVDVIHHSETAFRFSAASYAGSLVQACASFECSSSPIHDGNCSGHGA